MKNPGVDVVRAGACVGDSARVPVRRSSLLNGLPGIPLEIVQCDPREVAVHPGRSFAGLCGMGNSVCRGQPRARATCSAWPTMARRTLDCVRWGEKHCVVKGGDCVM
jgi:hypothetical protein